MYTTVSSLHCLISNQPICLWNEGKKRTLLVAKEPHLGKIVQKEIQLRKYGFETRVNHSGKQETMHISDRNADFQYKKNTILKNYPQIWQEN